MSDDPIVDLRFLQANERTLLAWVRTGLALMAFGFVVARLAIWLELEGKHEPASLGIGASIIIVGAVCEILGAVRFVRARQALIEGRRLIPSAHGPVTVAAIVATIGIGLVAYLFAG